MKINSPDENYSYTKKLNVKAKENCNTTLQNELSTLRKSFEDQNECESDIQKEQK